MDTFMSETRPERKTPCNSKRQNNCSTFQVITLTFQGIECIKRKRYVHSRSLSVLEENMFNKSCYLVAAMLLSLNLAGCAATGQISTGLKETESFSPGTTPPRTANAPTAQESVTGMEFVYIKGGCYQMGDIFNYDGDDPNPAEKPVHEVCVDDFYLGKYEVTQAQWKKIMGSNTLSLYGDKCDSPPNGDNCPVGYVKYNEVLDFINKLNKISGGAIYRLPTEAGNMRPEAAEKTNDMQEVKISRTLRGITKHRTINFIPSAQRLPMVSVFMI
jgi:Sulfatase-modifying factor enzyme 1